MKSILKSVIAAIAIIACLNLPVQAKSIVSAHNVAVSDTGKMAKDKMKMDKKMDKKADKMKMDKMKMDKKKMKKDSTGKM